MKTILLTGSTDGIGKLAATELAKIGHRILLHGRNEEKLQGCMAEIKEQSNNPEVYGYCADFSDLSSVRSMAEEVRTEQAHLDVLVNNAGIFQSPVDRLADGQDIRFVVNYLAPFLLTQELLPLLQSGSNPRLINLSSAAQSSISLDALAGKEALSAQVAYAQSKLALTAWSFAMAEEYENLVTIAVNPGSLLNTKMVQEAYGHHWSDAEKGSNLLVALSTEAEYSQSSGLYFDNDKGGFGPAHPDAYNETKTADLLRLTNTLVNQ